MAVGGLEKGVGVRVEATGKGSLRLQSTEGQCPAHLARTEEGQGLN